MKFHKSLILALGLVSCLLSEVAVAHGPLFPGRIPNGRARPYPVLPEPVTRQPQPRPDWPRRRPGDVTPTLPRAVPGLGRSGAPARPNVSPRSGLTGRRKSGASSSTSEWSTWWRLNRERYLDRASSRSSTGDANDKVAKLERMERGKIAVHLRRTLSDPAMTVRANGVFALGKVGVGASIGDFERVLRDKDRTVSHAAMISMGIWGDAAAAPLLSGILREDKRSKELLGARRSKMAILEDQVYAAVALGFLGRRDSVVAAEASELLLSTATARHPSVELNLAAIEALGLMRASSSMHRLIELMDDRRLDGRLRAACANALGKIGQRGAIRSLLTAVDSDQAALRRSGVIALGMLGTASDEAVVDALCASALSNDRAERHFALMALGEIGGEKARLCLLSRFRKGAARERAFAALAIGISRHPRDDDETLSELAKPLIASLNGGASELRGACALALGLLRHRAAAEPLMRMLKKERALSLRQDAATALGLLGEPVALDLLGSLAKGKESPDLRAAAAEAMEPDRRLQGDQDRGRAAS